MGSYRPLKNRKIQTLLLYILFISLISGCGGSGIGREQIDEDSWRLAVKLDKNWGAIDREGKYILNPSLENQPFYWNGFFTVVNGDYTDYYDASGKKLPLSHLYHGGLLSDGLVGFVKEETGQVGYKDLSGETVIEPQYEGGLPFYNGYAGVMIDEKLGFIDREGNFKINPKFEKDNMALPWGEHIIFQKDEKYGFMDYDGKVLIRAQFDEVTPFVDGIALVSVEGRSGFIDTEGKFVINPIYKSALPFSGEYTSALTDDDEMQIIDRTGKILQRFEDSDEPGLVGEDLIGFKDDGKWGYMDLEGEVVIEPQFKNAFPFRYGVAVVKIERKYGLIDKTGKIIVTPQFLEVDEITGVFGYGFMYFFGYMEQFVAEGKSSKSPKKVGEKFLKALAVGDYKTAKKYASPDSQESLEMLEKMSGGEKSGSEDDIIIGEIQEDGNSAKLFYTEKGAEKLLKLKKYDGEWKAIFSKGGDS